MKTAKAILISTIVLLLVLSSGCMPKKWSYDFTSATATLEDWYAKLFNTYRLDDDGLCLSKATITTPVYFTGDISIKIVFELDVSEATTGSLELGISDDKDWGGNNKTWATLFDIGNEADEYWKLGDYGSGDQSDHVFNEPIPNLDRDGSNVLEFKRIGTKVSLKINGDIVDEIDLVYFDINTDRFFPTLSAEGAIGTITFKSFEVSYSGEVSEEWPV